MSLKKGLDTVKEIADGFFNVEPSLNIFGSETVFEVVALTGYKQEDREESSFMGRILDERMAHHKYLPNPCDLSDEEEASRIISLHSKVIIQDKDASVIAPGTIVQARCSAGDNNMPFDLQNLILVKVLKKPDKKNKDKEDCDSIIQALEDWDGSVVGTPGSLIEFDPEACNGDEFFLMHPLNNSTQPTSLYGQREGGHHPGIDLGSTEGQAIYAAQSGTVTIKESGCEKAKNPPSTVSELEESSDDALKCGGGYGNHLIIAHDGGYQTTYAHLLSINVENGVTVEQGAVIGTMGSTGYSTGPHLHFELNDGALDPAEFIKTPTKCNSNNA